MKRASRVCAAPFFMAGGWRFEFVDHLRVVKLQTGPAWVPLASFAMTCQ
jgi:hypothetical protein